MEKWPWPRCHRGPGIHLGVVLTSSTLPPWPEQPALGDSGPHTRRGRNRARQASGLTFRVQGLDLKLQRGVLQVQLAGGGDDLNAVDEVHDGVAAQDLAGGCRGGNTGSAGGRPPHLQRLTGWTVLFFGKDKGNQQSPQKNGAGRTESTLRSSTRPESQHGRPGSKGLPDTFTAHLVLFHRERQRLKLHAKHSS